MTKYHWQKQTKHRTRYCHITGINSIMQVQNSDNHKVSGVYAIQQGCKQYTIAVSLFLILYKHVPFVVVRLILAYFWRQIIRRSDTCASQLHSTKINIKKNICVLTIIIGVVLNAVKALHIREIFFNEPKVSTHLFKTFAIPKSPSLTIPWRVRNIFWDFMSRCKIFLSCICFTARHVCTNQSMIWSRDELRFKRHHYGKAQNVCKNIVRGQIMS